MLVVIKMIEFIIAFMVLFSLYTLYEYVGCCYIPKKPKTRKRKIVSYYIQDVDENGNISKEKELVTLDFVNEMSTDGKNIYDVKGKLIYKITKKQQQVVQIIKGR